MKRISTTEIFILEMDGHKFMVPPPKENQRIQEIMRDVMSYEGLWEPETTKLVKQIVKPDMVCLDIGASIGYFTMLLARQVGPGGLVYAFEPTTDQWPYLCMNIDLNRYNKQTMPLNWAAWDRDEIRKVPSVRGRETIAECHPLDNLFGYPDGTKIDFIKCDVDGAEPQVLRGLIKTFENNPQLKMVFEYYPKYIESTGGSAQEVKAILDKYFTYKEIDGDYGDGCWNLFCERR